MSGNIFNSMESHQRLSQLNKLFKNLLMNQMGIEYDLDYNEEKEPQYVLTIFVDPTKFYLAMGADIIGENGESDYWGLMNSMDFRINNIIKYVGMEEDSVQIVYKDKDLSETQKFIERYIKSNFYKVLDGLVEDGKFERDELPKLEKVEGYRELDYQPHLYIDVLLSGNNKFGDRRIITEKILQILNLDEFLFTVDFEEQSEN